MHLNYIDVIDEYGRYFSLNLIVKYFAEKKSPEWKNASIKAEHKEKKSNEYRQNRFFFPQHTNVMIYKSRIFET